MVRMDSSGDREPDYSLKYYVNGSFQGIADYNYSTGGFNLRGKLYSVGISLLSPQRPLFVIGRLERRINKMAPGDDGKGNLLLLFLSKSPAGTSAEERV